jgi:hypothetical protein
LDDENFYGVLRLPYLAAVIWMVLLHRVKKSARKFGKQPGGRVFYWKIK